MSAKRPALTDQHLYLRLLILLIALVGNLGSSLRQLLLQIGLFLLFSLLDVHSLFRLVRALRFILVFLAAYWLFGTILCTQFPVMLLFSIRMIFFAQVSVYAFSHLSLPRTLHDCSALLKYPRGRGLLTYLAATVLFVQGFQRHWSQTGNSKGITLTDRFMNVSKACLAEGDAIAIRLDAAMADPSLYQDAKPASGLIGLALMTLMVLAGAV
ncbi:MAG TPA: hypothetical protein PKX36_03590 [Candidatus Cloacimonadota bacterium]|nr:hypothetical protein [Candidatus Cloacimonadota bacterium]